MNPSVTVVTPWVDHLELADDYWDALRGQDCRVLVIDNGSSPPLPNGVRLASNTGFAHACNVGLSLARTDAVLFLNNDIAARSRGWLNQLRSGLEDGVLVGAQLRTDPHGAVDGVPLPYLDGWCLGGMRSDLLDLGGWDESLEEPSYYGDNLLCLEARAAGMGLREARVGLVHKLNQTAGRSDAVASATAANRVVFEERARDLLGLPARVAA